MQNSIMALPAPPGGSA